jgi:hypothetical protein
MQNLGTKYQNFKNCLNEYSTIGRLSILYRGININQVYSYYDLDEKTEIDILADRMFLWGDKAKVTWNINLTKGLFSSEFEIGDISIEFFKEIFNQLNKNLCFDNDDTKIKTWRKKNKKSISYFLNKENLTVFLSVITTFSDEEKLSIRNYYLGILHQLGSEDNSYFVSSTKSFKVADKFSKKGIIIETWKVNYNTKPINKIICFKGVPYPKQKEISIYGAIFPHYITGFFYKNKFYANPALLLINEDKLSNEATIFSGFNIDEEKRHERVNYNKLIIENMGNISSKKFN